MHKLVTKLIRIVIFGCKAQIRTHEHPNLDGFCARYQNPNSHIELFPYYNKRLLDVFLSNPDSIFWNHYWFEKVFYICVNLYASTSRLPTRLQNPCILSSIQVKLLFTDAFGKLLHNLVYLFHQISNRHLKILLHQRSVPAASSEIGTWLTCFEPVID
jgi:hypothetical protein